MIKPIIWNVEDRDNPATVDRVEASTPVAAAEKYVRHFMSSRGQGPFEGLWKLAVYPRYAPNSEDYHEYDVVTTVDVKVEVRPKE